MKIKRGMVFLTVLNDNPNIFMLNIADEKFGKNTISYITESGSVFIKDPQFKIGDLLKNDNDWTEYILEF